MIATLALLLAADPSIGDAIRRAAEPCRNADADTIVVCRRNPATDRFRLPAIDRGFDPEGPVDSVSRERHRLIDADGGGPDYTRGVVQRGRRQRSDWLHGQRLAGKRSATRLVNWLIV